jgi:hypothetical protein
VVVTLHCLRNNAKKIYIISTVEFLSGYFWSAVSRYSGCRNCWYEVSTVSKLVHEVNVCVNWKHLRKFYFMNPSKMKIVNKQVKTPKISYFLTTDITQEVFYIFSVGYIFDLISVNVRSSNFCFRCPHRHIFTI